MTEKNKWSPSNTIGHDLGQCDHTKDLYSALSPNTGQDKPLEGSVSDAEVHAFQWEKQSAYTCESVAVLVISCRHKYGKLPKIVVKFKAAIY